MSGVEGSLRKRKEGEKGIISRIMKEKEGGKGEKRGKEREEKETREGPRKERIKKTKRKFKKMERKQMERVGVEPTSTKCNSLANYPINHSSISPKRKQSRSWDSNPE